MSILEKYVQIFSELGVCFALECNPSLGSPYRQLSILRTKGGKRFGMKALLDGKCVHVLPWEKSDIIIRNKQKFYSLLISFWSESAQEGSRLLFAQKVPWQQFYEGCHEKLFSNLMLIEDYGAATLCNTLGISRLCSGWVVGGDVGNRVHQEVERIAEVVQLVSSLQSSDPINEYVISRRKITTYIDGEFGSFDFSDADIISYSPKGGARQEIVVPQNSSYISVLSDSIKKIKNKRRLINLYDPPKKHFLDLVKHCVRYSFDVSNRIYSFFSSAYPNWEERESLCKKIFEERNFSSYANDYMNCTRFGELIFIYDGAEIFEGYKTPDLEMISCLVEHYTTEAIKQTVKKDVIARIG